jgi:hypothetical protein
VLPNNAALDLELPDGVKFFGGERKFEFVDQKEQTSFELRVIGHLYLKGKEITRGEVQFKVSFI